VGGLGCWDTHDDGLLLVVGRLLAGLVLLSSSVIIIMIITNSLLLAIIIACYLFLLSRYYLCNKQRKIKFSHQPFASTKKQEIGSWLFQLVFTAQNLV
jgi:uncharacterized membrane protein YqjE